MNPCPSCVIHRPTDWSHDVAHVEVWVLFALLGVATAPGYGYAPNVTTATVAQQPGADRINAAVAAASAAYYGAAEYATAATLQPQAAAAMAAGAGVPRSEHSPLPLSTSPMPRDAHQLAAAAAAQQRAANAAAGTTFSSST